MKQPSEGVYGEFNTYKMAVQSSNVEQINEIHLQLLTGDFKMFPRSERFEVQCGDGLEILHMAFSSIRDKVQMAVDDFELSSPHRNILFLLVKKGRYAVRNVTFLLEVKKQEPRKENKLNNEGSPSVQLVPINSDKQAQTLLFSQGNNAELIILGVPVSFKKAIKKCLLELKIDIQLSDPYDGTVLNSTIAIKSKEIWVKSVTKRGIYQRSDNSENCVSSPDHTPVQKKQKTHDQRIQATNIGTTFQQQQHPPSVSKSPALSAPKTTDNDSQEEEIIDSSQIEEDECTEIPLEKENCPQIREPRKENSNAVHSSGSDPQGTLPPASPELLRKVPSAYEITCDHPSCGGHREYCNFTQ